MKQINLNPKEIQVLAFLASGSEDFGCFGFAPIVRHTGLDRRDVRLACRSLKRKGMAQFHIGLWTDDGEPAGSGYSVTKTGRERADQKLVEQYELKRWQ